MYILECTGAGTGDFVFSDMISDIDEVTFRKTQYVAADGKATRVLKRAKVFATQREGKRYLEGMDPIAMNPFAPLSWDKDDEIPMPKFKLVPVKIYLK